MLTSLSRWAVPALVYAGVVTAISLIRWQTREPLSLEIVLATVALNGTMAFGLAVGFELADRLRQSSGKLRWLWPAALGLAGIAFSWHIGSELVGSVTYFEKVGYRQAIAGALAAGVIVLLVGLRANAFGYRWLSVAVLAGGSIVLLWAQDQYRMQLREARYAGVSAAFLLLTGMLGLRSLERLLPPSKAPARGLRSVLVPMCGFLLLAVFSSEFATRRLYFAGLFPGRFVFALYYPQLMLDASRPDGEHGFALARPPAATPAAPSEIAAPSPVADEIVILALVDAARYDAFTRYAERPQARLHSAWNESCFVGAAYSPASDTVASLTKLMLRPGTNELWVDALRGVGVRRSLTIDRETLEKLDRRLPSGLSPHFDVVVPLERSATRPVRLESVGAAVEKLVRNTSGRQFVWAHFLDVHEWTDQEKDLGLQTYEALMRSVGDEIAGITELLASTPRRATLIVTADHGEGIDHFSTRTHGQFLYEPLVRTPLMIWSNARPCAPGVLALANKPPIATLALGRVVLDQFGVVSDSRLPTLAQLTSEPIVMRGGIQDAVIRWPHKLIVSPWFMELFDLANDPAEQRDLIDQHAELAEELRSLLR